MMTWLNTVVKPNREIGTYDTHLQGYERYIRAPLGQRQAKNLTVPRVQAWVNSLSPRLSAGTIWRARATLRAALNYGINTRLFAFNPAAHVEMPKNQSRKVVILDPDELVTLLDHTAGTFVWGALYHLTAMTGLRESEVRGLVWDDIDLVGATIRLQRALKFSLATSSAASRRRREWVYGAVKTQAGAATLDLTTDAVEALRAHQVRQSERWAATGIQTEWTEQGLVFTTGAGNPLHQSNIGTTLRKHLAECGLPRTSLHALRHSYAALMVAADVNPKSIQEAMRHASIKTTLDTYGHLIKAKQTERLERVSGVMHAARNRAAKAGTEL